MSSIASRFITLLKADRYTQFLVGAIVLAILVSGGLSIWKWIFSQNDPAAWFQAIGSLIGIMIAIAVPMSQRYLERLDREKIRKQEERAIGVACFNQLHNLHSIIIDAINATKKFSNDPDWLRIHVDNISKLELSIPTGSTFRVIEEDWNRFKAAPQCLQSLIHEVKEYNGKISLFRNQVHSLQNSEISEFCVDCARSLTRIELAQQSTFVYFLRIL